MRSLIETVSVKDIMPEIREMKSVLRAVAKEAYIFGSVAIGASVKGESDVDLIIIPKKRMSIHDAYKILDIVFSRLMDKGLVLHVIVYDSKRHDKEILETAKKGYKVV